MRQQRISRFILVVGFSSFAFISFSSWRQSTQAQTNTSKRKAPNIVVLLADDMGYSDVGPFGSEIPTPNINSLAKTGTKLTNHHALPTCSPSRAELLSGVDNHHNGLGNMAELLTPAQKGKPGYEGILNERVVSLPTVLKNAGYHTYMAGKWHLGDKPGTLPSDRGFDQSFALISSGGSYYSDRGYSPEEPLVTYRENGQVVKLAQNFYSTNFFTDKLIEYIDKNRADRKPFFIYAAYTSPHEPLQAPQPEIQKQIGKYDMGWDQLRQQRFNRMKQMGLIPDYLELTPRLSEVPAWDSLTPEKKKYESKKMAIYAAQITNLDSNIGRLIDHLKKNGEYDNTIFVFLSDNGAAGQDYEHLPAYQEWFKNAGISNSYENLGTANSNAGYGSGWAQVGTLPFQGYKGTPTEGGIRVPAIFSYSGAVKSEMKSDAFSTITDVMPTLLDYAGVKHPGTSYKGRPIFPMDGRSLRPVLDGKAQQVYGPNDPVGFEVFGTGNGALVMGDWKILKLSPPKGDGKWKLYNLRLDPSELHDLGQMYPEQLKKMVPLYEQYEKEKGIVPAGTSDSPF
jgi:arylsulfatase